MEKPNEFRLIVNVEICNSQWPGGSVQARDEVVIAPVGFKEMAAILEAFHVLVERYHKNV